MMNENQPKPAVFFLGGSPFERLGWAIEKVKNYDDMGPLLKEIREGNPHLSEEPFCSFIADRLEGKPIRRRGEKPKNEQREKKHLDILVEVANHVADGVPVYSNSQDPASGSQKTACALAAKKLHVSESLAQQVWKNRAEVWETRGAFIRRLAIKLRCEIFVLTGNPAKASNFLDLTWELDRARVYRSGSIAGLLYRSMLGNDDPHYLEGEIKKIEHLIFPP